VAETAAENAACALFGVERKMRMTEATHCRQLQDIDGSPNNCPFSFCDIYPTCGFSRLAQ
jgi:hypothetical protein